LRADFHMHTHYSKDCTTSPKRLVARCLRVGLGCIAVTDHNTIRGGMEVAEIAPFPVIVASEVKTTHGEITGLFLTEEIPRGLSPMETVERIKAQGGLVSIPHPFDKVRSSVITDDAL
jgi:predicted metal-dependent phosphoesterase TrpH